MIYARGVKDRFCNPRYRVCRPYFIHMTGIGKCGVMLDTVIRQERARTPVQAVGAAKAVDPREDGRGEAHAKQMEALHQKNRAIVKQTIKDEPRSASHFKVSQR